MDNSGLLKLCVITEADTVRAAIRICCLPPNEVAFFSLAGFLDEDHAITEYGEGLLTSAQNSSAVLVDWSLGQAPVINLLCYEVRKRAGELETAIPVIALCSGSPEEVIAARAAGADEAMGFPLYAPLIQASVVSHRREVEAMRRAETTKLIDKISDTRDEAMRLAGAKAEDLVDGFEERLQSLVTVGSGAGTADGGFAVDTASFTEALVEHITDNIIENMEEELALVDPTLDTTRVGPLALDRKAYRFFVGKDEVELTPKEFELLGFLMEHADEVCSRDEILDAVWGIAFETGTNMVEVYMHFLRKKLALYSLGGMIQTVRGRGYRLSVPTKKA
jgi:DNA-binding response OmpR family regulator